MGFSESPEALYKIANALKERNLSWHGWDFTTVKVIGFLSLE